MFLHNSAKKSCSGIQNSLNLVGNCFDFSDDYFRLLLLKMARKQCFCFTEKAEVLQLLLEADKERSHKIRAA